MDATVRTLAAVGAIGPKVSFRNLGVDQLTWSVMLADLTPGSEIIPEAGQVVTLFRSGVRFFSGHAAPARQRGRMVGITVYGPWWWLERIFLESVQTDDTAATADRATYALPKQSLTTSLNALLAAAIAKGAPLAIGSLATTFSAPEIRLNQMSYAQAISEAVRITPDAVLYFDYSTATPTANTVRRKTGLATGSAASVDLDAALVDGFEINPLIEMQVSQVKIPYLQRAVDGGKKFALQTSGTASAGKVQVITVSGDEMDTFLPKDTLDSVQVKSGLWSTQPLVQYDPALKSLVDKYGGFWGGDYFAGAITYYTGFSNAKQATTSYFAPLTARAKSGKPIPAGTQYFVTSTDPLPEWAVEQLGAVEVAITGTLIATEITTNASWSPLFKAMREGSSTGGPVWLSGDNWNNNQYHWLAHPLAVDGYLIPTEYAALTSVYKASDYDFISPPTGFSDGLLAAQNYLAYDGSIEFTEEECGTARYLMKAVNLTHTMTAHATMRAMLQSEELDLASGVTTLVLGAPARFSYADLVNRIRGNSNSNIVYL